MSYFDDVTEYPPDQIYGLMQAFRNETNPNKIDLSIGVYKDESLQSECMEVVKEAEKRLLASEGPKSYLPIDGDHEFLELGMKLVFGEKAPKNRIYGAQTPGGTGALRIIGEFIYELGFKRIALPIPTWANHRLIFSRSGLDFHRYSHFDPETGTFMLDAVLEQLADFPENTAILFHGSCHNPTGLDPTPEEWKQIAVACKEYGIFPIFDLAYQGLGDGLDEDAFAIRHFLAEGMEMLVASSYSKNFGLYGERTGALFAVSENATTAGTIVSCIKRCIRGIYSTPPRHGSCIVKTILSDENLRKKWEETLQNMRNRMHVARSILADRLTDALGKDFSYIKNRKGMFAFIGLTEEQASILRAEYAIYMPISGRINVCGINEKNIDCIIAAIADVMQR